MTAHQEPAQLDVISAMLGALADAALVFDLASGRIVAANDAATRLFDQPAVRILELSASDLREGEARRAFDASLYTLVRAVDAGEMPGPQHIDEPAVGPNRRGVRTTFSVFALGRDLRVLALSRPLPSPLASEVDVEQVRRREQDLLASREEAEREARRKGAFYSALSRELRTPLTSILGYLDLIADAESQEGDRSQWLAQVRRSGDSLMSLVQDLVDLGQMEAGTFALQRRPFSLGLVIAQVLSTARSRAQQHERDVVARYTTPVPRTVDWDAGRLRQALFALISYAIEQASRSDVTLQVAVIGTGDARQLAFEVTALCHDLDATDLETLFDPFTPTSPKSRPWSLSFPVAKRLAELMGGTVTGNLEGDKLTFRLTLTPKPSDMQNMAHMSMPDELEAPPPSLAPARLRGRVLLVEDSEDDRLLVAKMLERSGLDIDCLSSGVQALEAHVAQYDALIMDVELPEMDGLETTRRLRAAGITVPIVALTAAALAGDRERCLDAGCTAYVTKPINRPMLLRTLDGMISTTEDRRVLSTLPPDLVSVPPLRSESENDPELAGLLPQLVTRMARYVDHIGKSVHAGDLTGAAKAARTLSGTAGNCGFPSLGHASDRLVDACEASDADHAIIEQCLDEVEQVAKRMRAAYPNTRSTPPPAL